MTSISTRGITALLLVYLGCTIMATSPPVPLAPLRVAKLTGLIENEGFTKGASSLINLWKHAIRKLGDDPPSDVPKTILAPSSAKMVNLVPQDAANPLYADLILANSFLGDHMIDGYVKPEEIIGTVSTTNKRGQVVYFKKDSNGQITVNNVKVNDVHQLSDGTYLYILDDVLMNYRQLINDAFRKLMQGASTKFGPFGTPLEPIKRVKEILQVPILPHLIQTEGFEKGASSMINLWKHALRKLTTAQPSSIIPKTIMSPSPSAMTNLVPSDATHPLYADPKLGNSFILTHMAEDQIKPEDIKDTVSTTNMHGEIVYFKKDANGQITVNNVKVNDIQQLSDGTYIYILDDLLMNFREKVRTAFQTLIKSSSSRFGPLGTPLGLLGPRKPQ